MSAHHSLPTPDFKHYADGFAKARSIKRHHHFYLGPTNSGKTHQAIQALIAAKSGVYLAPLRLLAMEIRDRLIEAGVPCNLVTGEERIIIPGAMHTASTIEMMKPEKQVDVAVIDEIQMLQDPDRGSAWTAALIGAPARQVFVCGANSVTTPCLQALELLNETYEITRLERMTPLILEEASICGASYAKLKLKNQLKKGDAIIAFSRKDVLTFSARFRQWGFSVASIYGALSPEVRRTESERFNSGAADILVATDAIGMGLNLPIQRVIFANIQKFDGSATRLLNATEVRQIAGRAGRHGIYPKGFVNVLEDDERVHIDYMLTKDDTEPLHALPIALPFAQLADIAKKLNTWRIAECFEYFANFSKSDATQLSFSSVSTQYSQALLIDTHAPKMAMQDKFILVCAPISLQVPIETDYFLLCLTSIDRNQPRVLPKTPSWLSSNNPNHLEEAENLSQQISLYAWLSYKFPHIFIEPDSVSALRLQVSRYIERALLTQSGYGFTSREQDVMSNRR
jgi:ATP-dependent RNA helicase SUPV3L1/SUV3